MKISLLCPTRKRAHFMKDMWKSALETCSNSNNIEVVFAIDQDDSESIEAYFGMSSDNTKAVLSPRLDGNLSEMWNRCQRIATGEIFLHCGDDLRFRTQDWDTKVIEEFNKYDDKIALVYGDDGVRKDDLATHGFIHKNWVDVVGYFLPPYFSSDMNDYWLTTVARNIDRLIKIDIYTEHLHPAVGKGEMDITHKERIARGSRDNVRELYHSKEQEREEDCKKLKKYIKETQEDNNE
tara:strand:- start:6 stop:716 length:711 start_codon:yes stop_codon:yes gene_type:complete